MTIKFGVAGNMTGHLEQAGEASDFTEVRAAPGAPKGMFPYHVPHADGVLGVDPVSHDRLVLPTGPDGERVQAEPEVGMHCRLHWDGDRVARVQAVGFTAYNDASIRKPAPKISAKKNWGPHTKGLAAEVVPLVDGLVPGCLLDHYHLASFLRRGGELLDYGEDSPVRTYAYFHERLTDWMVTRLNDQTDHGPLEDLSAWLRVAGRPETAIIGIGATRYTAFAEQDRLRAGDEVFVVVYDARALTLEQVRATLERGESLPAGHPVLHQKVERA